MVNLEFGQDMCDLVPQSHSPKKANLLGQHSGTKMSLQNQHIVCVVVQDHFRTLNRPNISFGCHWCNYSRLQRIVSHALTAYGTFLCVS